MFSSFIGGSSPSDAAAGADAQLESHGDVWQRFERRERAMRHERDLDMAMTARERWERTRELFPRRPPCARVPKPRQPGWEALLAGPMEWEWTQLRHATRQQKTRWDDASKSVEEMAVQHTQAEMDLRDMSKDSLVRTHGLQIVLVALLILGLWRSTGSASALRFKVNMGLIIFNICTTLLFTVAWVKSIMKLCEAIFLWLARTVDYTDKIGQVIALDLRKHILSSIFGMLIVHEHELPSLIARLSLSEPDVEGGSASLQSAFFSAPRKPLGKVCFTEELPRTVGQFSHSSISEFKDHPDFVQSVETQCSFIDYQGSLMRFTWMLSKNNLIATKVQDGYLMPYQLDEPHLIAWTRKPMSWAVDPRSKEVDDIVKSNPWWEKLEFQLQGEQSHVSGFRDYLGKFLFNKPSRFQMFIGVVPILWFIAMQTIYTWLAGIMRPEVYLDWYTMAVHAAVVVGWQSTCLLVASLLKSPVLAPIIVNIILHVLEKQMLKDLTFIFGFRESIKHNELDERAKRRWTGASSESVRDISSIPELWQVVSCEDSMMQIGEKILEVIVDNEARHSELLSRSMASEFMQMEKRSMLNFF